MPRAGLSRYWGLAGFAIYAVHGTNLVLSGYGEHVFWSCNLANLLVGHGILFRRPTPVGIGFLWLLIALPAWVFSIATGMPVLWSTVLPHVGGLALAAFGVRALGLPRGTWWRATAALVALWGVTRYGLRFPTNVNIARTYWFGWEGRYLPYLPYMALLFTLEATIFRGAERLLRRWGARRWGV